MFKVKVTVHKDVLVISTDDEVECEGWVPAGDGNIGCVLINTKGKLGISQQALKWLQQVKKSRDAIGDVDAWVSEKGPCFGWLGGPWVLKPKDISGSRNYDIDAIEHDIIPNEVPADAMNAIDKSGGTFRRDNEI